jgi:hypothetical protein
MLVGIAFACTGWLLENPQCIFRARTYVSTATKIPLDANSPPQLTNPSSRLAPLQVHIGDMLATALNLVTANPLYQGNVTVLNMAPTPKPVAAATTVLVTHRKTTQAISAPSSARFKTSGGMPCTPWREGRQHC